MLITVVTMVILYCPLILSRIAHAKNALWYKNLKTQPKYLDFITRPKSKDLPHHHHQGHSQNSNKVIDFNNFDFFLEDDTGKLFRLDSPTETFYYYKPEEKTHKGHYGRHNSKIQTSKIHQKLKDENEFFKPNENLDFGSYIQNYFKICADTRFVSNFENDNNKSFRKYIKNRFRSNKDNLSIVNNYYKDLLKIDEPTNRYNRYMESYTDENKEDNNIRYKWIEYIQKPYNGDLETISDEPLPIPNSDEFPQSQNDEHHNKHGHAHSSQYIHRHVEDVNPVLSSENDQETDTGYFRDLREKKDLKEQNDHAHPKYKFSYKVEDTHTGDKKSHEEQRDGDEVKGHYEFKEPDGSTRSVHYHADKHTGFHADVKHEKHQVVARHHHLLEDYHH